MSNPGGISPAVQNSMDKYSLLPDFVKDSEWEAMREKAVIALISLAMDATVQPQRFDIRKKIRQEI